MNKRSDWFHLILEYLYNKPLDGMAYDTREILNIKSDFNDFTDLELEQLENVLVHLAGINYINLHQEKRADYKCMSKLGGIVYDNYPKGTLRTLYVMASMNLDGYNYMENKNRAKRQEKLFWVPVFISIATLGISYFNYKATTIETKNLQQQIKEQDTLLLERKNLLDSREFQLRQTIEALDSLTNSID